MNESRQQQILAGQSSIAQKVFGHVPIQASWSAHDIHGAVIAANATGASAYAIRRALGELKDAGLIRGEVAGPRVCYCIEPGALRRLKALIGGL